MKRVNIVFTLLSVFVFIACLETKHSQTIIKNGILKANLYLPDNENGYYVSTRFDWSGIISSLEYEGHTYYGKWFNEKDPTQVAIMGPVEAYSPLNFNDVKIGNEFVKIGIGALKKNSEEEYNPFKSYTIVDPGTWTITKKTDAVEFIHILNTDNISYEYTKSVQLIKDEAKMVITHCLKNTGKQSIKTEVFNHNFFVIDDQTIGKDFELIFPTNVYCADKGRGIGDIFEIQGRKIRFNRDMQEEESIACRYLEGICNSVKDFDIRIENLRTGAGVRISGDHALSRLRLWGNSKTVCPETYLNLSIDSSDEFRWSYYYEFYEIDAKNDSFAKVLE